MVAVLGSDVTKFNTFAWFPSFQISDLNHEGLHTVVFSFGNAASEYDGVGAEVAEVTRPKLSSSYARSMNHKLVSLLVPDGSGLYAGNVGTVADFGLSIATNNVEMLLWCLPSCLLFITGKFSYRITKH